MPWPNAEHYRRRAEELRAAAEHMDDESARENLLELARQYEEMAEKTIRRRPDHDSAKSF
jgi:hypothetical protein